MKQYKVLTQSDSYIKDRLNPTTLENALNELAVQGWEVVTCTTTEIHGLTVL